MSRPGSLQKQLGVGLAIGVTALWLLATLASTFVIRHELDEAFDSNLQEAAQRLLPLAVIEIVGNDVRRTARTVPRLDHHDEFLTYIVRNASGEVLLQSHNVEPSIFSPVPARGFRETATHRFYGEAAISGTVFIEVAEPLVHRRKATMEAALALLVPLVFLLPASLCGIWWFVKRHLKPVTTLGDEIRSRSPSDLTHLKMRVVPDEISPIVNSVNVLLDRLRRTLEAERSFAANSAHELRTPIAATLAQTQRLIALLPEGECRDRAQYIEGSLQRLASLSEKLLQLARAEGGGLLSEYAQDFSVVLSHVIDEFQSKAEQIQLEWCENATLISHMDADAFGILMRNLIENALKYGETGKPVKVVVSGDRQIRVINRGPIVPPDMLKRLKGRFERGTTEANGAGLGLAIAELIVAGSGGELRLISPAPGQDDGFEAYVRLTH